MRQDLLGNLVEHRGRAISVLLVDYFEAVRITKRSFDAGEGVQNLWDVNSDWRVESVLLGQLPLCQGLLHMFGSEEGVKSINRVLENVKGQASHFPEARDHLTQGK